MRPMYRITSRNIGSEQTIEHLKNIATLNYYEQQIPYDGNLEKEAVLGERIWKPVRYADPWERLAAAVIGRAADDYCCACISHDEAWKDECRQWLERNEYSFAVLEELDRLIKRDGARDVRNHLRLIF